MAQSDTQRDDSGINLEAHVGEELWRPQINLSLGILRDPRPHADHAKFELPDGKTIARSDSTVRTCFNTGGEWRTLSNQTSRSHKDAGHSATRVDHCMADETDVYTGRGPDQEVKTTNEDP
ncbi:hypothetical protein [Halobacterium salinarum]|uniref:hypothetical protein n=1 Tax=Halobacterium salinarum TaxID=2242 RepID=UPI001F19ECEF|nr:hypothetical protein [Halobacterium salinarum]MCF2165431.1 hypothetical protein [Halobacterium salinarum]MCF2168296.1 hypothetical protein [Halobacterium salinarum]